jgi:hypothetical protein
MGPPTLLNPERNGIASWQNPGLNNPEYNIFTRIDIVEETCYNSFPYPHIGFLYTYVKINIPLSKLNRVLSMTGDIMYDPIKKLLVVRGMSLNYNIALISIVCRYVNEIISWCDIIDNDMIRRETHHKRLINIKVKARNLKILNKYLNK